MEDHGLPGDQCIPSRDDFTQGPISECDAEMNTTQRQDYWKKVDVDVDFGMDVDLFYQESIEILDQIEDCEVVLWQGDSCHDILATAWLTTYFSDRDIEWSIIDLGRLSPGESNDDLPAVNLAMFSPSQIPEMYVYKQKLGVESLQLYRNLWKTLRRENGAYRIKRDNEIVSVAEEYHDVMIRSYIPLEWRKASDVIRDVIQASSHTISDTTSEYRIRQLIREGKIEYKGELKGMDNYFLRRGS